MTAKLASLALALAAAAGLVCLVRPGSALPPAGATAPEFAGVSEWINAKPLKLADQRGKVVALHFWTNGCVNCVHNYPHYRAWQDKYKAEKNLLVVGVHTPEFDSEKDVARIKERMTAAKLSFAVAVDNDSATWKAWGNRYWPCLYLVDKAGKVRFTHEGELGADGFRAATKEIDALLAEPAPARARAARGACSRPARRCCTGRRSRG